ncbi:protein kinase domain-containing protein [Thermostilla marina]
MSLSHSRPPTDVPGYDPERLLGVGAYGEVWVAIERNTGRRVAIKFYTSRGGLDWSLLSREVEKLSFLFADRYIVQLIAVGWDADPPYYIMEYMEHGSLADRLENGPLPVDEAVSLFHDIAVGLLHAHGKGVLHCDLKPANVLLDQDGKPRLADFGQARLSHEQAPALGTLFHMAPEQADLAAVPDARWDVYALGSLAYCMLTGRVPHRNEERIRKLRDIGDLDKRLKAYRQLIHRLGVPTDLRRVPGVDRGLVEIIERCLEPDPRKRFPNVESVLSALEGWSRQKARRPLVLLGLIGPMLLLIITGVFARRGFNAALDKSGNHLTILALENNRLTAEYVAGLAGKEIRRRYEAVEQVAENPEFQAAVRRYLDSSEIRALRERLNDENADAATLAAARKAFRAAEDREALQQSLGRAIPRWMRPPAEELQDADVASWFFCDPDGTSVAREPFAETIGRNYAWRSFFTGYADDLEKGRRPPAGVHLKKTALSAVFRSEANGLWIVAVATPVVDRETGRFMGVVALTVEVNRFIELRGTPRQYPILVEMRPCSYQGMVLQHPLFHEILQHRSQVPEHFQEYRLDLDHLPVPVREDVSPPEPTIRFEDPLAKDPEGAAYAKRYLAQMAAIRVPEASESERPRARDVGWAVIVVQDYDSAITEPLQQIRRSLVRWGLAGIMVIGGVLLGLWAMTWRMLRDAGSPRAALFGGDRGRFAASTPREGAPDSPTPDATVHSRDTIAADGNDSPRPG